jgi:hypothetical protein
MKRRREGDDVWRKKDREVAGVEKGKRVGGKRDGGCTWCVATLLHGAHALSLRDEVEPANQNLCPNDSSVNPPHPT